MTRLDQLMPYDLSQNADDEYRFLLAELKRAFLYRISRARQGQFDRDAFDAFASHCATNQFDCIISTTMTSSMKRSATPAGGPPSGDTVSSAGHRWTRSPPSTPARHAWVRGCCAFTGASTGGRGSGTPNRSHSTRSQATVSRLAVAIMSNLTYNSDL